MTTLKKSLLINDLIHFDEDNWMDDKHTHQKKEKLKRQSLWLN